MHPRSLRCLALLLPFFAFGQGSARAADPLAELRTKLGTLKSEQSSRATISAKKVSNSNDEGEAKQQTQEVTVGAEIGPRGLTLTWTRPQVEAARQAARKKAANPDATSEKGVGLGILDAEQAAELLDYAEALRIELEGAKLIADRLENRNGKPTRVLVVEPRLSLSTSERKSLKSSEDELKVWLDSDGAPIATERKAHYKFSKFLISFEVQLHEIRSLARLGGRLVVLQSSSEQTGAGLGRKGTTQEIVRVTPTAS